MRRSIIKFISALVFIASGFDSDCASAQAPVFGRFIHQIDGVWPEHVVVDHDGRIVVFDALQRRVRTFDKGGKELEPRAGDDALLQRSEETVGAAAAAWHGIETDALPARPIAVAIAEDRTYLVDANNHLVICLDKNGDRVWCLGGFGMNPGQFAEPTAIAWVPDSETLLVADSQNHRIQAINGDGEFLYEWGKHALVPREGNGKIHYPNDIAVAPDGSFVVVAEIFERRIQIFGPLKGDAPSVELPALTQPDVQSHFGKVMAVDGRLCAVWEPELRRVLVFDMGRPVPIHITSFGSYGTRLGQFSNIAGLAIDENRKTIYVLDDGTRRIDVVEFNFDPDAPPKFDPTMAKFVRSIPLAEILKLDVNDTELTNLALLTPEVLAIVDARNAIVHEVRVDGVLRRSWSTAFEAGQESRPVALASDAHAETVYVVDEAARCVSVFAADRTLDSQIEKPGLRRSAFLLPTGVCVSDNHVLYVTDAGLDGVLVGAGEPMSRFGRTGTGDGELWMPSAIGIDCQNRIVVLDHGNHRCQLFTTDGEWLASFSAGRARTRKLTPAAPAIEPAPD